MSLTFLRGQGSFMRAHGLELCAVSSPGKELEQFGAREEISVKAVKMHRAITPLRDISAVWRLRKIMARLDPSIVHAHTPKGGLLGMVAATFARVPIRVYHLRG